MLEKLEFENLKCTFHAWTSEMEARIQHGVVYEVRARSLSSDRLYYPRWSQNHDTKGPIFSLRCLEPGSGREILRYDLAQPQIPNVFFIPATQYESYWEWLISCCGSDISVGRLLGMTNSELWWDPDIAQDKACAKYGHYNREVTIYRCNLRQLTVLATYRVFHIPTKDDLDHRNKDTHSRLSELNCYAVSRGPPPLTAFLTFISRQRSFLK